MAEPSMPDPTQQFHVSGKKNTIKKVKQTIVVTQQPAPAAPAVEYRAKWSLTTPLTQGRLAVTSVVLGLLALAEGYQGFAPLARAISGHHALRAPSVTSNVALIVCAVAVALAVVCIVLRRMITHELRGLSRFSFLPAVVGSNGRLAIERFAGRCAVCNGKLRFYAKPTEWIDHTGGRGSRNREVTERRLAAECTRNPQHWFEIDPAEGPQTQ